MGAQQSIDTLTSLVDPYAALETPSQTTTTSSPPPSPPQKPVHRTQPSIASSPASASTSHISLTIDLEEIEINPHSPVEQPSSSQPSEQVFEHPVDQIMSRIAPPSVVAMLASPQNSVSELPLLNPRAS